MIMNTQKLMKVVLIIAGLGAVCYLVRSRMAPKKEGFDNENNVVVNNLKDDMEPKVNDVLVPEGVVEQQHELQPSDLLPQDSKDEEFAKMHPLSQGLLENKNFLEAGHHIGAISEPMRSSNLSLRAMPPISRTQLSPWNNSTKADEDRRGFTLGY